MRLSVEQYAEAVHEILQEKDVTETLSNLEQYLTGKGEKSRFGEILEAVIRKEELLHNIEPLTIFTKFPVETKERQALEKKVQELYPNKSLDLTYSLDQSLIGGFRIQGRDTVYDHTLLQSLNQFSQALKS
jgi:F0F1-type ATP synthase delta subunit